MDFDDVFDISWSELEPELRQRWSRLDNEDLAAVARYFDELTRGEPELLVSRLRERYNLNHEQATMEVRRFLRDMVTRRSEPRPQHSPPA